MKQNPGVPPPKRLQTAAKIAILCVLAALLWWQVPSKSFPDGLNFGKPGPLQLWYWQHTELTSDQAVASAKSLIDRAVSLGYTGVAFWDSSFNRLGDPDWPRLNIQRLKVVLLYASKRGLQVMTLAAPFGWSNAALIPDGNLAESQRVSGSRFVVDPTGTHLQFLNSLPPLRNSGFEQGQSDWFGTRDADLALSNQIAHSGEWSGMIVDSHGNSRFRQKVELTPWRQYHVSLWVRSRDLRGPVNLEVVDWWHRRTPIFYAEVAVQATQEWTKFDYSFDSRDTTSAYLYFGLWGKSSGIVWFDDVTLEETALVYVVRRTGSPLRVSNVDSHMVYREGRDYDRILDPVLSPPHAVIRDSYHVPVSVTIPRNSSLRPGMHVSIDYYAAFPIPGSNQMGMCLTDEGVFRWLRRNTSALRLVMPRGAAVLLSYDEMRQVNSCGSCRARHLSAGELLAWNVSAVTALTEQILPGTQLYVWNDMFDPFQNATDRFYYVEGALRGSWKGLKPEIGILNWNRDNLKDSLEWFSGTNRRQGQPHRQIIASYYDCGRGTVASTDLKQAQGVPGLQGLMYVTWRDDYSQMESFAASAKAGWNAYLRSIRAKTSNRVAN